MAVVIGTSRDPDIFAQLSSILHNLPFPGMLPRPGRLCRHLGMGLSSKALDEDAILRNNNQSECIFHIPARL